MTRDDLRPASSDDDFIADVFPLVLEAALGCDVVHVRSHLTVRRMEVRIEHRSGVFVYVVIGPGRSREHRSQSNRFHIRNARNWRSRLRALERALAALDRRADSS